MTILAPPSRLNCRTFTDRNPFHLPIWRVLHTACQGRCGKAETQRADLVVCGLRSLSDPITSRKALAETPFLCAIPATPWSKLFSQFRVRAPVPPTSTSRCKSMSRRETGSSRRASVWRTGHSSFARIRLLRPEPTIDVETVIKELAGTSTLKTTPQLPPGGEVSSNSCQPHGSMLLPLLKLNIK